MTIVSEASKWISQFEGFEEKAYKDVVGIWTVGFGRTGKDVGPTSSTTRAAEQAWLEKRIAADLAAIKLSLSKVNPKFKELPDACYIALCSLVYNIGITNFNSSTIRKKLRENDLVGASLEFPKWNKAGGRVINGLTNRRLKEQELFKSGIRVPA